MISNCLNNAFYFREWQFCLVLSDCFSGKCKCGLFLEQRLVLSFFCWGQSQLCQVFFLLLLLGMLEAFTLCLACMEKRLFVLRSRTHTPPEISFVCVRHVRHLHKIIQQVWQTENINGFFFFCSPVLSLLVEQVHKPKHIVFLKLKVFGWLRPNHSDISNASSVPLLCIQAVHLWSQHLRQILTGAIRGGLLYSSFKPSVYPI